MYRLTLHNNSRQQSICVNFAHYANQHLLKPQNSKVFPMRMIKQLFRLERAIFVLEFLIERILFKKKVRHCNGQ